MEPPAAAAAVEAPGLAAVCSPRSPTSQAPAGAAEDGTELHANGRLAEVAVEGGAVPSRQEVQAIESPAHSPLQVWPEGSPPILHMGSKLDKSLVLKSSRWVKVGRGEGCELQLPTSGVSRNHCGFMWDPHRRVVELRDTSTTGTLVNGEVLKNSQKILAHSDLVRVLGKGAQYDFVLDLRPVRLGFGNPVETLRERLKSKQASRLQGTELVKRRDTLEAQLHHLDKSIQRSEARALEMERTYYETLARRKQRSVEDKQRSEELLAHERGAAALEARVKESRQEWMAKLQGLYDSNQAAEAPLIEDLKLVKDKSEKMRLKKGEIERAMNPEKFMIQSADDDLDGGLLELNAPAGQTGAGAASDDDSDVEGEEEAFADKKPASAVADAAAAAAAVDKEDPMAELFGDWDSADEAEAARDAAMEAAAAEEEGGGEPPAKRPREAEG